MGVRRIVTSRITPMETACAAASGVLGFLSFPRFSFCHLIWWAFVPLLLAVRGRDWQVRFVLGFITGVVGTLGAFSWVWGSIARFLDLSAVPTSVLFLVFLAWHPVQFALFGMLAGERSLSDANFPMRWSTSLRYVLVVPCVWVVLDAYCPKLFPWHLGNALEADLPFVQLADLTGVGGLSWSVMVVNALLADAWSRRREPRRWLPTLVVALGVVLSLQIYGQRRMAQIEAGDDGGRFAVAVVQGNVPAMREMDAAAVQSRIDIHAELSLQPAVTAAQLIIWPEGAVRASLLADVTVRDAVFAIAERAHTILLIGVTGGDAHKGFFNSAYLITPFGDVLGSYNKTRLFPFGEHLPAVFSFLARWWPIESLTPGTAAPLLLLPGTRFGPSICYEAAFPGFFRPAIRGGAAFLVNITNDVWFGDGAGPYDHLQVAVMRAVESRRWLVRAANSGVSALIAPSGRVVASTALSTRGTLTGVIGQRHDAGLYMRWGDWFVHLCLAGLGFLTVLRLMAMRTTSPVA